MRSSAMTVEEYLADLPHDRRAALLAVRRVILENLDTDFEEGMQYGMIGYYVPHSVYPAGYHCDPRQPLPYLNLGSQKNHMALYLMCLYADGPLKDWFTAAWRAAGKKLDMEKSCLRFKSIDDLALDVIAEVLRRIPAKKYIQIIESAFNSNRKTTKLASVQTNLKAPVKKSTKKVAKTAIKKMKKKSPGRLS